MSNKPLDEQRHRTLDHSQLPGLKPATVRERGLMLPEHVQRLADLQAQIDALRDNEDGPFAPGNMQTITDITETVGAQLLVVRSDSYGGKVAPRYVMDLSDLRAMIAASISGTYEPPIAAGTTAQYWRGDKTWQTLNKTAVGLGSVDNVQQMPLSYLDTDGSLAANSDAKVPSQKAVKTYAAAAGHTHAQLHDRAHAMASASDHSDWPAGLDVTELGYVNGVTGAIQTQLDAKQASLGYGSADLTALFTRRSLPPYTTSQLHFEGSDASTTITDANSAITWAVAGNAQLDTAAKKFGSSSLLLGGNGDWIQSTAAVLLAGLGTQDFTVDCWVYITTAMSTDSMIAGQGGGTGSWADSGGHHWCFFVNGADQKLYFQAHISGNNLMQVASTNAVALRNGWHHVAFDRYGGNGRLYVDGTAVSAVTGFSSNITATTGGTQVCRVGAHAVGTTPLNGWVDEFRLSLGVSRYQNAASFTNETSAYSDSVTAYEWSLPTVPGLSPIAANSIVGNNTAGSLAPAALTAAQTKTLLAIAQADVSGLTTASTPLFAGLQIGNADTGMARDKANSLRMNTGDQFWSEGLVAKAAGDLVCYLLDTYGANLVGLWLGDQTGAVTTLTDKSLAAHNATLSANASTLTPDVDNLARHLTLGTATFTVADHADFSPGNGTTDTAFSVISLVYPTTLVANQNILSKWKLTTGSAAREWRVLVNTSGSLYLECYDQSASAYIGRTKASVVTSGAWQTLFGTYSGSAASSGIKLYRNGAQVDDSNSASGSYTAMEDGDGVVGMHRISTAGAAEEKFSGKVAVVAYIKAELTAAQCKALDAKLRGTVGIAV